MWLPGLRAPAARAAMRPRSRVKRTQKRSASPTLYMARTMASTENARDTRALYLRHGNAWRVDLAGEPEPCADGTQKGDEEQLYDQCGGHTCP